MSPEPRKARTFLAAAALLALAAFGVYLLTGQGGALARLITMRGEVEAQRYRPSDVPACGAAWRVSPAANPSKEYNELHAVAASPDGGLWAVGTTGAEDFALTLVERWEGGGWRQVPSPSVADFSNHLHAVVAFSPGDVWALGASHRGTELWKTLALHWDGAAWTTVPTPNRGSISMINGAAALSPSEVWAVGEWSQGQQGIGSQPLLVRWDGKAWTTAALPDGVSAGALNSAVALADGEIWAAGWEPRGAEGKPVPLLLRLRDGRWSKVAAPGAGTLYSIAASGPRDIWAVGDADGTALALHWDGTVMRPVPVPSPGRQGSSLSGVAVVSEREARAVGTKSDNSATATFALRWDGSRWQEERVPSPGDFMDTLSGVAAARGGVWAVGSYITDRVGTNMALAQQFSDPCAGGPTLTP